MTARPDQAEVLAYTGGYMAVSAVPGSGKTWVLARLAADLIAAGRTGPAGQVLVVTYTHSAVGNFKARIAGFLEAAGLPRTDGYDVRTLHSLALLVVRERPGLVRLGDNFTLADQATRGQVLQQVAQRWIAAHRDAWSAVIRPELRPRPRQSAEARWEEETGRLFGALISQMKARGVDPAAAEALAAGLPPESFLGWCAAAYRDYQAELAARGLLDYDDLVANAHRLLRADPDLLARLSTRWPYILEDEAQDSSPLQAQMLELLAGPDGNLVRVGDPNQAILSTFTAADPLLFRRFWAGRPPGLRRTLTYAGRSSPDIIDLANRLVAWSIAEQPEVACRDALADQAIRPLPAEDPLTNPRPAAYQIRARIHDTYSDELDRLAEVAARAVRELPDRTVGVLLPTNEMVQNLAARLERLGVPVELLRREHPRAAWTVEHLVAALDYLAAPWDGRTLSALLARLLPVEAPGALGAYLRRARLEEDFFPLEERAPFAALEAAVPGQAEAVQVLDRVRGWLEHSHLPADALVLYLAAELDLQAEQLAVAQQMALSLRGFLKETPAAGVVEAAAYVREHLDSMARAAAGFFERRGLELQPGRVYVATYHSAKGLEWDVVCAGCLTRDQFPATLNDRVRSELWFLPDDLVNPTALALAELEEGLDRVPDPDPIRRAKADVISEKLRLLYVGVTRARESLLLSGHLRRELAGGEKVTEPAPAFQALAAHVEVARRGR